MSDLIEENKSQLREKYREAFDKLPQGRKIEASMNAALRLGHILKDFKNILSFSSMPDEINTEPLNALLAERGQLLLPKVKGKSLNIYRVTDTETQLQASAWGILEPIADSCEEVPLEEIQISLVPAIAFDHQNHRLGRGSGYYDRFLISIPDCPAYGLGLFEQLSDVNLPVEPHDIPLTGLYLF